RRPLPTRRDARQGRTRHGRPDRRGSTGGRGRRERARQRRPGRPLRPHRGWRAGRFAPTEGGDEAESGHRPRRRSRARPRHGGAPLSARSLRLPVALPRFERVERGRVVAGVAAGIGEALAVDPTLVRLAFAFLAFASGAGVVAYV